VSKTQKSRLTEDDQSAMELKRGFPAIVVVIELLETRKEGRYKGVRKSIVSRQKKSQGTRVDYRVQGETVKRAGYVYWRKGYERKIKEPRGRGNS